jgi:hypothetical protein
MSCSLTPGQLLEVRRVKSMLAGCGSTMSSCCHHDGVGATGPTGPTGATGPRGGDSYYTVTTAQFLIRLQEVMKSLQLAQVWHIHQCS